MEANNNNNNNNNNKQQQQLNTYISKYLNRIVYHLSQSHARMPEVNQMTQCACCELHNKEFLIVSCWVDYSSVPQVT